MNRNKHEKRLTLRKKTHSKVDYKEVIKVKVWFEMVGVASDMLEPFQPF